MLFEFHIWSWFCWTQWVLRKKTTKRCRKNFLKFPGSLFLQNHLFLQKYPFQITEVWKLLSEHTASSRKEILSVALISSRFHSSIILWNLVLSLFFLFTMDSLKTQLSAHDTHLQCFMIIFPSFWNKTHIIDQSFPLDCWDSQPGEYYGWTMGISLLTAIFVIFSLIKEVWRAKTGLRIGRTKIWQVSIKELGFGQNIIFHMELSEDWG